MNEFEEDMSLGSYSNIPYQYQDNWFFSDLSILLFINWERNGLKSLFNSILGNILMMVELLFFQKKAERDFAKNKKEIKTYRNKKRKRLYFL